MKRNYSFPAGTTKSRRGKCPLWQLVANSAADKAVAGRSNDYTGSSPVVGVKVRK